MKAERSILVFTSLSLLALAIFTSYNTPVVDRSAETEYLIDIENYKQGVAERISIDIRRIAELNTRFEIKKSVEKGEDEDGLIMLKEKIGEMQTALNNYEGNGLDEWELFKAKFDDDLNDLHESLINLIVKKSHSLNADSAQVL